MNLEFADRISYGASGEVFRALDVELKREVAVKFFFGEESASAIEAIEHARALARVESPNVVQVLAVEQFKHPETDETRLAIVMELVPGRKLFDSYAELSAAAAKSIGLDVIAGLSAIHSANLVHADLHDGNILVTNSRAKVIDILYFVSLAECGTRTKSSSIDSDLRQAMLVLSTLLEKTQGMAAAVKFATRLEVRGRSLEVMRDEYVDALEPSVENTDSPSNEPTTVFNQIDEFYEVAKSEALEAGFPKDKAYRDVLISAPDTGTDYVDRKELSRLVDDSRVELEGYGGLSFPCKKYPAATIGRFRDGMRLHFESSWNDEWDFRFWRIDTRLRFMRRMSRREDEVDEGRMKGSVLGLELAVMDICRALSFASALRRQQKLSEIRVEWIWSGLKDRRLEVLSHQKAPLRSAYTCSEPVFRPNAVIHDSSVLQDVSVNIIEELAWFFGWERFSPDHVVTLISEMLAGRFP